jgi:hypothetical protein
MKKSIPEESSELKDSGHAPITTIGKVSWPSSCTVPEPVETVAESESGGVVSMYGSDALRPSAAFAFTHSW